MPPDASSTSAIVNWNVVPAGPGESPVHTEFLSKLKDGRFRHVNEGSEHREILGGRKCIQHDLGRREEVGVAGLILDIPKVRGVGYGVEQERTRIEPDEAKQSLGVATRVHEHVRRVCQRNQHVPQSREVENVEGDAVGQSYAPRRCHLLSPRVLTVVNHHSPYRVSLV